MIKRKGAEGRMKDTEARQLLRKALDEQQTISIPKLKRILEAMNVSLKKDNRDREIEYLRNEIRKLRDGHVTHKSQKTTS